MVVVDGQWGFGQVQAHRLLDLVIPKARALGLAAGTGRNFGHIGRLGEYAERAAAEGLILIATVNNNGAGQRVAPAGRPGAPARDQPALRGGPDRRRPGRPRLRHQRRGRGEGPGPLLQRQEAGPRGLAPRPRRAGRPPTRRSSTSRRSARSCRWAGAGVQGVRPGPGPRHALRRPDRRAGRATPARPGPRGTTSSSSPSTPSGSPASTPWSASPAAWPATSAPPPGPRASPRSSCPATPNG